MTRLEFPASLRPMMYFIGCVALLSACQTLPVAPVEADSFERWCSERGDLYRAWRSSQPETQQRLADSLVVDLTRFLFHPPPGGEKYPFQTIEGWKERYLSTVCDLGKRLRAFTGEAPIVALAAFGMKEPEPPPDEPYHRYQRGRPSTDGYLRFLWEELVLPGKMEPQRLQEPLLHILSPRFTMSRFCAPGEGVREHLELNHLGTRRDPSPFQVRCDVEWTAGDAGRVCRGFPWRVGGTGGGHDDLGVVYAPRTVGEYIIQPTLYFEVIDAGGTKYFESRQILPELRLAVCDLPDQAVERVIVHREVSEAAMKVRWVEGTREADNSLSLTTEFALSLRVPDELDAGIYLHPRVVLEDGREFSLKSEVCPPGRPHDDGTGIFKRTEWIPAPPPADGIHMRSFWTVFACSQRVEAKSAPGPGKYRARLELHPNPAEARHSGESRMLDLGVLGDQFELVIR